MADRKVYHIPRKVNEGFKLAGLGTRQMVIMIIFIAIAAAIGFLTPLPLGGKVVIATLLIAGPYGLLTLELGNGLVAVEYVKLQIKYMFFDQNEYTLTSASSKEESSRRKVIVGRKKEISSILRAEREEVVISDWQDANTDQDRDEVPLEDFAQWIAKPKNLSNKHKVEVK